MSELINIEELQEKVILIGVSTSETEDIYQSLKELSELVKTAGALSVGNIIQNREKIHPATYIGKGKIDEVRDMIFETEATGIVCDDELSPAQLKNLERELSIKVMDRTMIILDIFAKRASTSEGKIQVELAQLKYSASRLVGLRSSLSRLGGGIGTRGPGEKQLEIDKRHIRQRIIDIQRELKEITKNRQTQRSSRMKSNMPLVALVGYTNSGKSTILNEIIKTHKDYDKSKEVDAKDMLFATLDVQLRKATLPSNSDFLITDTVGFVSSIPHDLIDAFKATLEEVKYADLLLHVVDLSNDKHKLQMDTTNKVLSEIGVENKKMLYVFNKADKVDYDTKVYVDDPFVIISATKRYNLDKFYEMIEQCLNKSKKKVKMLIPFAKSEIISKLHEKYNFEEDYDETGTMITVNLEDEDYNRYNEYISEEL